ncbi:MAG TPA: UDP-N-acetylmuramoyl-tripeptide--D-alanyl-D-alanine ligase, partial [Pseudohongiella sp.]|nr:UDP-N-acetylmuramoyl-tripeptide--D-alanyl-D-alanine ligase [Pseudohongiella sp.]
PHIVLINNATETHLEGFGSLQGVVRAKGEIVDSGESTHTVILNADDDNCEAWRDRAIAAGRQVRLFSIAKPQKPKVDYQALNIQADADGSRYTLTTPKGWVDCFIPMPGRHIVANAVAAAALAVEAGASLEKVAEALACVKSVPGRLYPLMGVQGARLLDDSYNASPSSFKAAIDVLADICHSSQRRAVVIMGDMAELGDKAEMLHAEIGSYARERGANQVWSVGALSILAAQSFGDGAHHFDSQESLCAFARDAMANDMVVLVKGSRSAGMDAVVAQLTTGGPH